MATQQTPVKPRDFIVLAPANKFLHFGFWRPGMERLHAKMWDTLREMGVRFWSDLSREILVHPEDFEQANAVLLCVERQLVSQRR